MCPLWPFHYIILYIILFFSLHFVVLTASKSLSAQNNVIFYPHTINNLLISETKIVDISIPNDVMSNYQQVIIDIKPKKDNIVICSPSTLELAWQKDVQNYTTSFNITGYFLGSTDIVVQLNKKYSEHSDKLIYSLPVIVIRKERLIDRIFTISVATLVSVLFVNFGCALDWKILLESLKKPISLLIGIIPQFIFMPLISYLVGILIFPASIPMQLGLFFTGISPSGGASNLYVCMFGGNLNLSIAITALGNFFAFFTMPLWTFTLGHLIFSNNSMVIPYSKVATYAFSLLPPILLGLLMQNKCPKFSQTMVSILKPLSSCLILFIIIFATLTNLYLFKLFTGKILLAGFLVPTLGFVLALLFSYFFNRSVEDIIAISVETAVQNTGIAIFMLRFSLKQPEADLTTVIPVAVALMTPVPLFFWYFGKKYYEYMKSCKGRRMKSIKHVPSDERSATSLIDQKTSPSAEL